jgi:hypothetical protein
MVELPKLLAAVAEAAEDFHRLDAEREEARARLYEALHAAHGGGASYALLGRIAGLSRQGIARSLGKSD